MGGKGSGGIPRTPEFIARAVKLAADLGGPKLAAEQLTREGEKVSWRSIYNWQRGEKGARKAGVKPRPRRDVSAAGRGSRRTRNTAAGPSVAKASAPPPEPPAPIPPPPEPPPGLKGVAFDLWIIEQEILATRAEMNAIRVKAARDEGSLHGLATLGKRLDDLMDRRRQLRPPEPVDPHEEEHRWQAAAERAVSKIRAGVRDARERMAALLGRPFPIHADVGVGG